MIDLKVYGMSCAACSSRIERALSKIPGVERATVNFLTNTAQIEGTVSEDYLISFIRKVGYDAVSLSNNVSQGSNYNHIIEKDEELNRFWTPRLVGTFIFTILLFVLATGACSLRLPIPKAIDNVGTLGVLQLVLSGIIIFINRKIFVSGFVGIRRLSPNMDTLVALGSGTSFLYSFYLLLAVINSLASGNSEQAVEYGQNYYFESAGAVLFFIVVGKSLENRAKGKTTSALKSLIQLAPDRATVVRDEKEYDVNVADLQVDDVFVVKPGCKVPVDGIVVDGSSAIDESTLTGESCPVDKVPQSPVFAGTFNSYGFLKCRATRVGSNTKLGQIIELTSQASISKAPVARLADSVSGYFVPFVICFALLTVVYWLSFGMSFQYSIIRGITVLTISCPCALGLATPTAIMVGMGIAAKKRILFKTSESLEKCGKVKTIAFDKTGVLTFGRPRVSDFLVAREFSEDELLRFSYSLESKSEHPIAYAITQFVEEKKPLLDSIKFTEFQIVPGNGLYGLDVNDSVFGGKLDYIRRFTNIPDYASEKVKEWEQYGWTPVYFTKNSEFLGIFAITDFVKPETKDVVAQLKRSFNILMLTGDSKRTAETIGKNLGISEIISEVLPDEKEKVIKELSGKGRVAFVGDGVNDAPALTRADVGIALATGSDVAVEAADVTLTHSNLKAVPVAMRISRATLRVIYQNLFWAFCYNVVGIPLAAGFFSRIIGWSFSPAFGAFAMCASSVTVVFNSLRLYLVNFEKFNRKSVENSDASETSVYLERLNKNEESNEEETEDSSLSILSVKDSTMRKIIKIEGMMCHHCEKHVKEALEKIPSVTSVQVDYKQGEAIVEIGEQTNDIDSVLKDAVVSQGYTVLSVN